MAIYSPIKRFWDKATSPFVLGGWLLLPFFGAMARKAHSVDSGAGLIGDLDAFYGPVVADPVGSVVGFFDTFIPDAASATTSLGAKTLSVFGLNTAGGSGLVVAFNFATGAAIAGGAVFLAYKLTSAIFDAKPEPAAA